MPELPEVEVLVRHLAPLLENKTIRAVQVRRPRVIAPSSPPQISRALRGAKFTSLQRRGKYLIFTLRLPPPRQPFRLVGHLGMTGRMYLLPARQPLPKHAAVILALGATKFVYEDPRAFGRLTLDTRPLARLGPEPLESATPPPTFFAGLRRSAQPIKVKLLDQSLIAGVGNIYASETLFRARLSPRVAASRLTVAQAQRLWQAVREVLREAITHGSTLPLDWAGAGPRNGLFYYGRAEDAPDYYEERLRVYDRAARPCPNCGVPIRRCVQAARSTFYCPRCQR